MDAGQRAVQELARARLLHHLGARVAAQIAEAVVAEDDRSTVHLRVGDDEIAICAASQTRPTTCKRKAKFHYAS